MNRSEDLSFWNITDVVNITMADKEKGQELYSKFNVTLPVIGLLIIVVNLCVVISSGLLLRRGTNQKATYLFLGNVSMADLMIATGILLGEFIRKSTKNNPTVCAVQLGFRIANFHACVFAIGLLAVDRFLYIKYSLKYRKWVYPNRARVAIAVMWILCYISGAVTTAFIDSHNGETCWFIMVLPKEMFFFLSMITFMPMIVVLITYSVILYIAIKRIKQVKKLDNPPRPHHPTDTGNDKSLRFFKGSTHSISNKINHDKTGTTPNQQGGTQKIGLGSILRPTVMIFLTVAGFLLTFGPLKILNIIFVIKCDFYTKDRPDCKSLLTDIQYSAMFTISNSLINPILYAWWHKGFRTFVKTQFVNVVKRLRPKRRSTRSQSVMTTSTRESITSISDESASSSTQGRNSQQQQQHQVTVPIENHI